MPAAHSVDRLAGNGGQARFGPTCRAVNDLPDVIEVDRIIFDKAHLLTFRSVKHLLFYCRCRIVTCATNPRSVSLCGTWGPLLLARLHCYVAHFNCEQELNSTCSRSFLDQHTSCYRDALLSNARLTFTPQKFLGIRPQAQSRAPLPSFIAGKEAFEPR